MTDQTLSLQLSLDQPLSPRGEPSQRILEISVHAAPQACAAARPPLNAALVLDRSGSMSGNKLEFVKLAAQHVVDLLEDSDRLGLVAYDDEVRVLARSAPLDSGRRQALHQAIRGIHTGGSTNLSAGWLAGCQDVAASAESEPGAYINRALLLTDGLANAGITNPVEMAQHAGELARRGVFTSTFGVGAGFNHHLLESMANQGEGRFYFIECPEDIPNIFEQEFTELTTIAASAMEITLLYPAHWQVFVPGDWRTDGSQPGKLRVRAGSLGAGRSKEIYVRLDLPASGEQEYRLQAAVVATDREGNLPEDSAEAVLRLASAAEAGAAPKDEGLLERYARVDLAHQSSEALKLEMLGKREQASRLMRQSLERYRARVDYDTQQEMEDLSQRMATGMDELERKRRHAVAYSRKQRLSEQVSFPLLPRVLGHLVIDVYRHPTLINTGAPVSIGMRDMWSFMDLNLRLQKDFLGVTVDYLRQVIGAPVDFMLGTDVLRRLYLEIDLQAGAVVFSQSPSGDWGSPIPLEMRLNIPTARLHLAGQKRRLFVDTSARLSYLTRSAAAGLECVDREWDFYPGLGQFETDVYLAPFKFEGQIIPLRCGVLPPLLEATLLASEVEGILGAELYQHFRAGLALKEEQMFLKRVR